MTSETHNPGHDIGFRNGALTTGDGGRGPANEHTAGGLTSLPLPVLLTTLRRNKWVIAALAALGLLTGLVITLLTERVYEASAQIEVSAESLRAVEVEGQPTQSTIIDETYLETQEELLRTRALRERVARATRIDLDPNIVPADAAPNVRLEAAVRWLSDHVEVNNLLNTRLFTISVESANPARAAEVANAYVEQFIDLNIERQLDTSSYARDYLADQIEETRENLEASERALVEYARDREIVTLSTMEDGSAGTSLATQSLSSVNDALVEARTRRIAAQQRLQFANRNAAPNPATIALQGQLAQLRAEYRQKSDLFRADYPEMVALQEQIDSLESSLSDLENQSRGDSLRDLQSEYNAALGAEQQLEQQLANFRSSALDERGDSIQYNILRRDVDTNAAQYDALLERFKQIGTAGTQVQNLISVVDAATVPRSPIRPILAVNLALGLIAGLALGIIGVLLSSLLSTKVRNQRDVDQLLGRQFIGAVPLGEEFENISYELRDPKAPIHEAFVSIANRMRFATSAGFPKIISLSSTVPNEGKSSTAYGLAYILSRQGQRILLIDGDLRMPTFLDFERGEFMPSVREQAKANSGRGLTDVLVGEAALSDVTLEVSEGLHLVPSGETPPNPPELLVSERFVQLLSEQSAHYDHIIVDAPPVLGLADSPIIASLVDGTIFVVQANRATSQQIRRAIQRLSEHNGDVVGVVLTQTASQDAEDEYGYDYQYSYGSKPNEARGLNKVFKSLQR